MKAFKRTIALVLTLVTLFSLIPVQAFAEESEATTEMNTGDMTIEGTNGFGTLLSQEIQESQEESSSAEEDYAAGYSVVDLTFEGVTATVEYSSLEDAILVVAVYSEDGMQLLASGNVQVSSDEEIAFVTVEGNMPEYFQASAYLVDTYDLSPLCAAYDTPMYTREMQELLASTVDDYDPELVLNLDEDETTNFAVYSETTKIVEHVEGMNTVTSVDDETATYVIENADEQFTTLQVGDIFAYEYGENEMLIAKVATITVDGTTVTITGAELEMVEVFSHVKITDSGETEDFEFEDESPSEGVTLEGVFSEGDDVATLMTARSSSVAYKKYAKFVLDHTLDKTTPGAVEGEMKLTGTLKLSMGVSFEYYCASNKQHCELRLFAETEVDIAIDAAVKLTLPLVPAKYSNLAVEIGFEPEFIVEVGAKVSFKVTFVADIVLTFGPNAFDIRSKGGYDDAELTIEGTLFVGINLNPVVEVAKGYLADLDVEMPVGLEIEGTLGGSLHEMLEKNPETRHDCQECLDIGISLIAKFKVKFQFLKSKWLKWEVGDELSWKLQSMYLSLDKDTFGVGECPYKSYQVVIGVKLLDYLPDITVSTAGSDGGLTELGVTDENGLLMVYLPAGKYKFVAEVGDSYLAKTQKIKKACKVILDNSAISDGRIFHESEDIIDDTITVIHGKCGEDVFWSLSIDGVLNISGTGPMWNYDPNSYQPWGGESIPLTEVIIGDGVTTIGDSAFSWCQDLTNVKIPNSVTIIGASAFECTSLTNVKIPNSVITIGDYAFDTCQDLTNVKIPNSVTTIGVQAFDCGIYVDERNLYYSSDNWGVLFDKEKTLLIHAPKSLNSLSYEIPDSVTSIGDNAFTDCGFVDVTIGASVTSIGDNAFSNLAVQSVVFRGDAPAIGYNSFLDREYFTIYYPVGNATWTASVMENFGCTNTSWVPYTLDENGEMIINEAADVTVAEELPETDVPDALDEEPVTQTGLEVSTLDFGGQDENLSPAAAYGGEYSEIVTDTYTMKTASFSGLVPGEQYVLLAMVNIDVEDPLAADNLLYIDQAAALEDGTLVFQYVQRVTTETSYVVACGASNKNLNDAEITFPEMITDGEVQTVNPTVVYDGKNLTEGQDYTILGTVSFIEPGTYTCYIRGVRNYAGLVECTYTVVKPINEVATGTCGSNLTWSFYDNGMLKISGTGSMTAFSSLNSVPWHDRNSSIASVVIDYGVTTISDFAFTDCTSLTSVVIGDSVTTIGDYAFDSCTSLTSVTIPDSVTTIGSYVFRDCTGLTNATIGDGVTTIGTGTFQYCSNLTNVTIGVDVTFIKYGAFKSCTSLTRVTIPDGVTTIGNEAFKSCTSLTSVTIPASVTTIGDYAFQFCTSLTEINVDENNPNYSSDDRGVLLDKEKVELIQAPGTISDAYEIPDSVTTIDDYAFSGCANLTSVTIPEGVKTIGSYAFQSCTGLTSMEIPSSVSTIGDYAFSGCTSLCQIRFMGEAPAIAGGAFSRVTATVYYPANKSTWTEVVLQNYGGNITWETYTPECTNHSYGAVVTEPTCTDQGHTTYTCSKCGDSYVTDEREALGHSYEGIVTEPTCTEQGHTTYTCSKCGDSYIADETEALGHTYESNVNEDGETTYTCIICGGSYTEATPSTLQYVIEEDHVRITGYTGSATELAIPAEIEGLPVTSIGGSAFQGCSKLTSITIPDSITTIGNYAFSNCYRLTDLTIPDSVTSIGNSAFEHCIRLTSITIPNSVTSIGSSAFYDCSGMTSITISDSITTIGDSTFWGCYRMTSVSIPNTVTSVGDLAFYRCQGLTSIDLPDDITSVGVQTFADCSGLTDIFIPDSVVSISRGAFLGCSSLTSIDLPDGVTSIGDNAFGGCSSLTSITIPDGVASIGNYAFSGCSGLTDISIPDSVVSIGSGAFGYCSGLTSITIPNGVNFNSYEAFIDCSSLTSIDLPDNITSIAMRAFNGCSSLTSIDLPDGVTSIGDNAFGGCSNLASITIPDGVTSIGDNAFGYCSSLLGIYVDGNNQNYSSDEQGILFDKEKTRLIQVPGAIMGSCVIPASVTSICDYAFTQCTDLTAIHFNGDAPAFGRSVFEDVTATAYYPIGNTTWTVDVMQDYDGTITWTAEGELGELLGLEIVSTPEGGIVGKEPELSGLSVELVYSNERRIPVDNSVLTIGEIDTSTVGKKTVTISYSGFSVEFTYFVHESGPGVILDPSLYPETEHNYENDLDDIRTLTWPGATGIVLVFSESTFVENNYDWIYVYDGNDSLVASYTGSGAAGVTLEVPGDTVKIQLISDYSTTDYGYSFTSISTADTIVHTGTDIIAAVEATCTESGRTEGFVCEVCDQEQYTVIPTLGHDYESVVTSPDSGVYSYATHTCARCGDSYIDNVTVPGSLANGTCGDTLFWAVTEAGILHIFGEGEMVDYEIAEAPWYQYEQQFQHAVIHKGVTTIGVYAFYNHTGLISVEIQDSVTTIGERAFYLCEGLTSVEIPDSVTTICDLAFYQCTSLTSLEIPNSVITIGNRPFQNCKNLESIYVDDDNLYFSSDRNGILFNKQQTTLIHAPQAISGDYTIPDGVIEIGSYAFAESNSLTSVEIPASVNTIGDLAFFLCSSLKGIYVDENNPNFSNDSYGVLLDNQQMVLVKAPTTISGAYVIPASVTAIGDYAFYNCRSLTSIDIPSNVATIGDYAFYNCRSLTSIDIRAGVTTIGTDAFCYTSLTSVVIPDSVTTIGDDAFSCCENLTSVKIPGSVTTFGDFAFQHCEALTSVEISDGVTKFGRYAFSSCVSLESVSIPASVTIIDESAFDSCEALTSVEISDGVTIIGRYAFARCFNLASVKIPASVTTINESAFSWCTSLSEITFCGNAPIFDDYSFRNVTATAYYPATDSTWTVGVMQNYGGTLTWKAYTTECTDHTYEAVVTEPTCTEQGYTTYTCSVCGHCYVDNYVDSLGHNYVDGACIRCGEKDPNAAVIVIASQPTDYVGLVGDTATFSVVAEGKELKYQWYFYDTAAWEWRKSHGNTFAAISVEFKAYRNNQEYRCEITDSDGHTVTTDIVKLVAKEVDLAIVSHPVDYVGSVNDNVSMEVEASGNGLTYQWYFSDDGGVTWAKSGSPGFATANLQPIMRAYRDAYKFYCLVTDIFGNTAQSDVASMTVKTSDVVITKKPVDVNGAKLGELYYFEAEATGDNLEYRWEFSSDGGETWQLSWNQGYNTATLGVRMNANRDGYLYRCKIVSGLKTVVYTEPVSLNLQEPSAQIVTQPTNVVTIINKTIKFQVKATGTDLTYKWYRSNDKGATWIETFLSGYNTDTLSFVATNARAAMYMCKVTDGSGRVVWSSPVKLQILSAELKILNQPENITCASGATATFTVKAQGDGLKYQWYASSDGGETWTLSYLGGYNTDTFSFAVNAARAAKLYKCVITDAGGNTVETDNVSITIG